MLTTPATSAYQDFLFWGVVTQNCVSTNLRSHFGSILSDSRLTWPSGISCFPSFLLGMASGADARRELVNRNSPQLRLATLRGQPPRLRSPDFQFRFPP